MVKNCDRGLENAALGLRPRAVFSRPRSQFFTIRTSQPANNIYLSDNVIFYIHENKISNSFKVFLVFIIKLFFHHNGSAGCAGSWF